MDIEHGAAAPTSLDYPNPQRKPLRTWTISWADITVTVKDRGTKLPLNILDRVSGLCHAGTYYPSHKTNPMY